MAALQDLLVDATKRLGWYNHQIRTLAKKGGLGAALEAKVNDRETDKYTMLALFSTLTNVNFDANDITGYIIGVRDRASARAAVYSEVAKATGTAAAKCPTPDLAAGLSKPADLAKKGELVGLLQKFRTVKNDTVVGLSEMLVYGLKGVSAYADHAILMGEENNQVFDYLAEALAFLISPEANDLNAVLGMLLRCGEAVSLLRFLDFSRAMSVEPISDSRDLSSFLQNRT